MDSLLEVVEVRRAVAEDAAQIAAVHVRTWQAAYHELMPTEVLDRLSVEQREETWRQALTAAEPPAVWVAVKDGAVVGFCAVAAPSRDDDAGEGVAEIGALYVDPDVWRTGVGRALMEAALSRLRAGGWGWATLWVLAENRQARDFYAQFGLEPDGAESVHGSSGAREIRLRGSLTGRAG